MDKTQHKSFMVFGRNYNDIDCRAPLIQEIVANFNLNVEVVTIPTLTSTGLTVFHDISEMNGVSYENIFKKYYSSSFFRIFYFLTNFFENNKNRIIRYRIWPSIWQIMMFFLINRFFERQLIRDLSDKNIIIDDVYLEENRSPVSKILRKYDHLKIYCLSHGQNTIKNLWYDKSQHQRTKLFNARGMNVYVPSKIDIGDLQRKAKNFNPIIIGNTRFDKYWIENDKLRNKENFFTTKLDYRKKILFFMSKLNYGQSANEVRKLIIDIVDNNDFVLCLTIHAV